MARRHKKRGRPRTGRDPMIGVRLPERMIKKIAKVAEARSANRSDAVRWLLEQGLDSGAAIGLLRTGHGRGMADRIARATMADVKAAAAEAAASRDTDDVAAQIKALRAREDAIERTERVAQAMSVPRSTAEAPAAPPPFRSRHAPRRRLSEAELRAAADRAEARSESTKR